jgi:solute carrier family 25 (mitochondrial phosphate transporter), member 3
MSLSKPQLSKPRVVATSVYDFEKYTLMYYTKAALAGGICTSITHGALTPVDVVKTRIQLYPEIYNKGMVDGFKKVIANEGAGALLTGFGATAVGYFVQG